MPRPITVPPSTSRSRRAPVSTPARWAPAPATPPSPSQCEHLRGRRCLSSAVTAIDALGRDLYTPHVLPRRPDTRLLLHRQQREVHAARVSSASVSTWATVANRRSMATLDSQATQGLDFGVDYGDALQLKLSRRTTLSLTIGVGQRQIASTERRSSACSEARRWPTRWAGRGLRAWVTHEPLNSNPSFWHRCCGTRQTR